MDIFNLSTYSYDLPEKFIASKLKQPRDTSRLMVMDRCRGSYSIRDEFKSIIDYLDDNCVLVTNNTRVFPARVVVEKRETGGRGEMLFVRCIEGQIWEVVGRRASKMQPGDVYWLVVGDKEWPLPIKKVLDGARRLVDVGMDCGAWEQILSVAGQVPLPPYIKKDDNYNYRDDYQTVFAKQTGSVAAPTAGFHFTPELISNLKAKGVIWEEITLHVGLGTFLPVRTTDIRNHQMHQEQILCDLDKLHRLNKYKLDKKRIVAVGTTSVRYLESLVGTNGLLTSNPGVGQTDIFIYPGYKYKFVDEMITNFHLSQSTLLMLVAGFIYAGGVYQTEMEAVEFLLKSYQVAIKEKMRFYSFGDAMYIY
ncbi:MAG: tRNA preQ1(34) S-adenosylmethionine ribosyltransferase-isomerase QueA [Patescibacteria group bacterium]